MSTSDMEDTLETNMVMPTSTGGPVDRVSGSKTKQYQPLLSFIVTVITHIAAVYPDRSHWYY